MNNQCKTVCFDSSLTETKLPFQGHNENIIFLEYTFLPKKLESPASGCGCLSCDQISGNKTRILMKLGLTIG